MTRPALTPAQQRALDWLPKDGAWKINAGALSNDLISLGRHCPRFVESRWGNYGSRGGRKFAYRLTPAGVIRAALEAEIRAALEAEIRAALEADAPALLAAKIEGLKEASEIASSRASHYAKSANEHPDDRFGEICTAKCGAASSIANAIEIRIADLQAEMGKVGAPTAAARIKTDEKRSV